MRRSGSQRRGFTLVEAMVVLAIIAMLSVLLFPTFVSARRHLDQMSAMGRMRQLAVGFEIYRQEWDGVDVFTDARSFHRIGLPLVSANRAMGADLPGVDDRVWESPCSADPPDEQLCRSAWLPGSCGYLRYVAGMYQPKIIFLPGPGNGNRIDYGDYIATYRENIVLVVEPHCNPTGTNMVAPLVPKRGIALLLSGVVVSRYATGDASKLQWYSDEPIN